MTTTTDLSPTPEQHRALKMFATGDNLALEARAGAGKTSTLSMLAHSTARRGLYVAFNKSIVADVGPRMPGSVVCQPDGTMVRVPIPRPTARSKAEVTEVPIESLRDGDRVVSWNQSHSGGVLRKSGRPVTVTAREYDGRLVSVMADGYGSRYTPEHPCIVTVGDALDDKCVVYLMRRGSHYRVGVASWRIYGERFGLVKRAQQEGADAMWVLSVHDDKVDALLAEALTQHQFHLPGWRFREVDGSAIDKFWTQIPSNEAEADECLTSHGRLLDFPLWTVDGAQRFGQQPIVTAAANLLTGMRVLLADHLDEPNEFGRQRTPRRVWRTAQIAYEWYTGRVTSLEVADDHTYVADGIVTHNCSTAHSLAYRAVGAKMRHRLNGARIRSDEIARILRVDPFVIRYGQQTKVLQPSYLGGLAMRAIANYCNSADPEPTRAHVPYVDGIDEPLSDGRRGNANNRELAALLEPSLKRAWADLCDTNGRLRYSHDCYLKQWALTVPQLGVDYVLADEAQDLSPVMVGVLFSQRDTQIVAVGDSAQNIYGWRGSVDAMQDERLTSRSTLSMSFRFGPAVAEVANRVLTMLGSTPPVEGTDRVASVVGPVADPDAILCRTNAAAVDAVLAAQTAGGRPHLVGGGAEVVSFAKAAQDLQQQGRTWHPELACFESWNEVVDYVEHDQLGGELRLMVNLVEEYGVPTILRALEAMPTEDRATVVVSTAHKAKGREFGSVRLAGDFPQRPELPGDSGPSDAELRLLYVAATRAKRELDVTACTLLHEDDEADVDPLALPVPPPVGDDLRQ